MAREHTRAWLIVAALLVLAVDASAQHRRHFGGPPLVKPGPLPTQPETPLPPLTIPGLGPAPGAKTPPGRGAKKDAPPGKKGPAKAPAEVPLDPMHAADRVTEVADHQAEEDENATRQLREHFGVCDLDENGWLSLREATVTLSLARDEYKRLDANQDGRVDFAEFAAQRDEMLARLGVASPKPPQPKDKDKDAKEPAREPPAGPEPVAEPESGAAPASTPDEPAHGKRAHSELADLLVKPVDLLRRYDTDHSKGIGVAEIAKLLDEIGLALSAEMVVAQMDPNHSGELGARELTPLAWLASKHLPESLRPDPPAAPAPVAGAPSDEIAAAAAIPPPAEVRIPRPFDLLDPSHDGFIDEGDLRTLQSHVRLDVRLRAVLGAMDADGDGKLSEREFRASMGRKD